MATKRAIPPVPKSSAGTDRQPFDVSLKENVETLMGQRGEKIELLKDTASLREVISKVNQLLRLLQE